jgi:hypothetical protein
VNGSMVPGRTGKVPAQVHVMCHWRRVPKCRCEVCWLHAMYQGCGETCVLEYCASVQRGKDFSPWLDGVVWEASIVEYRVGKVYPTEMGMKR